MEREFASRERRDRDEEASAVKGEEGGGRALTYTSYIEGGIDKIYNVREYKPKRVIVRLYN